MLYQFTLVEALSPDIPDNLKLEHGNAIASYISVILTDSVASGRIDFEILSLWLCIAVASAEGETLTLSKVTRSEMGVYQCIASNGVTPSVSKRMMLHVHCEYALISFPQVLSLGIYLPPKIIFLAHDGFCWFAHRD